MIHSWIYNNTLFYPTIKVLSLVSTFIQTSDSMSHTKNENAKFYSEIYSHTQPPFLRITISQKTPHHKHWPILKQFYPFRFSLAARVSHLQELVQWYDQRYPAIISPLSLPCAIHGINSWARCPRERPRGASHVNVKRGSSRCERAECSILLARPRRGRWIEEVAEEEDEKEEEDGGAEKKEEVVSVAEGQERIL